MGICGVNARGKCYTERNMNCKEGCPSGWHVMKTFAHGCCRSWTDCGGNRKRCRKQIPCEGPCVERKKMNCKQGCESGWTHIATENYGCCASFNNCGGNMKVCQRETCNCQDTQNTWKDQDGDDCAKYEKMGWCGASWQHMYKDPSGLTADQGCCACQDRRRFAPTRSGSDKPSANPQADISRLAGGEEQVDLEEDMSEEPEFMQRVLENCQEELTACQEDAMCHKVLESLGDENSELKTADGGPPSCEGDAVCQAAVDCLMENGVVADSAESFEEEIEEDIEEDITEVFEVDDAADDKPAEDKPADDKPAAVEEEAGKTPGQAPEPVSLRRF